MTTESQEPGESVVFSPELMQTAFRRVVTSAQEYLGVEVMTHVELDSEEAGGGWATMRYHLLSAQEAETGESVMPGNSPAVQSFAALFQIAGYKATIDGNDLVLTLPLPYLRELARESDKVLPPPALREQVEATREALSDLTQPPDSPPSLEMPPDQHIAPDEGQSGSRVPVSPLSRLQRFLGSMRTRPPS